MKEERKRRRKKKEETSGVTSPCSFHFCLFLSPVRMSRLLRVFTGPQINESPFEWNTGHKKYLNTPQSIYLLSLIHTHTHIQLPGRYNVPDLKTRSLSRNRTRPLSPKKQVIRFIDFASWELGIHSVSSSHFRDSITFFYPSRRGKDAIASLLPIALMETQTFIWRIFSLIFPLESYISITF